MTKSDQEHSRLVDEFFDLTNATQAEMERKRSSISEMEIAKLTAIVKNLKASNEISTSIYTAAKQNFREKESEQKPLVEGSSDSIRTWLSLSLGGWLLTKDRKAFQPFENFFRSDDSIEYYLYEILSSLNANQRRNWIDAIFEVILENPTTDNNLEQFRILISTIDLADFMSELEHKLVRETPEKTLKFLATLVLEPKPELFISALASAKSIFKKSWFHLFDRYECVIENMLISGELDETNLSDFGQKIINAIGESDFEQYSRKMVFDGVKFDVFSAHISQIRGIPHSCLEHAPIEVPAAVLAQIDPNHGSDSFTELMHDIIRTKLEIN